MQLKNLYEIAEKNNVTVTDFPLPVNKSLALLDESGSCHIAIDRGQIASEGEEKVRLSHELGHCIQGAFYNRYSRLDLISRHEHRADTWSIQTLIPADELRKAVMQGNTEFWQLAEYFDLPESFVREAVSYYEGIK
jgi:hypothetical protein